jgi:hypothetical protein
VVHEQDFNLTDYHTEHTVASSGTDGNMLMCNMLNDSVSKLVVSGTSSKSSRALLCTRET